MSPSKFQIASMNKKSSGTSKPKFTSIIAKVSKPKNTHKKNDSGFSEEFFSPIPIDSSSKNKKFSFSNVPYSNCLGLNNTPYGTTAIHSSKKGRLVYNTDPKLNAWFKAPLEIALKWKGFAPEAQLRSLCRTTSKISFNKNNIVVNVNNVTESGLTREAIIEKFVKLECDTIYLEARAKVIARKWAAKNNAIFNAEKRIEAVRSERKQLIRDNLDAEFELEEKLGWKRIEAFRKSISQTTFIDTKVVEDIDFYLEELEGWSRIDSIKSDLSQHKGILESPQESNWRQQIAIIF
ncbi:11823_t:CDS:2, partial [Ambispora gerdemannii]